MYLMLEGLTCLGKKNKKPLEDKVWVGHYLAKRTSSGGLAINTRKEFSEGHTHVRDIGCAKWLCEMAINKIIPRRSSLRDLVSLMRITDDEEYYRQIEELYLVRKQKGRKDYYFNPNKGTR